MHLKVSRGPDGGPVRDQRRAFVPKFRARVTRPPPPRPWALLRPGHVGSSGFAPIAVVIEVPAVADMVDGVEFGPFRFEVTSGALSRRGMSVRLQPQPARVLAVLVRRPGEVVSRDELRQQIWPEGTYVDFERGLNFAIAHI